MSVLLYSFIILIISIALFNVIICNNKKASKKIDPNDNKGNTPFILQDPYDGTCLGPNGFTMCDDSSLWILTKRTSKRTYSLVNLLLPFNNNQLCLQKKSSFFGLFSSDSVVMGSCSTANAKAWDFEFIDQTHVRLSTKDQCLIKGKKSYKNSVSLQSCKKGEFIPLVYHPTAVHENGFYLKTADNNCFDGSKFRPCDGSGGSKLLWGAGIKFVWGEARRYFFNFNLQERSTCIVAHGSKVEKGSCSDKGATSWALSNGKLSNGNRCVQRRNDDTAMIGKCTASYEYMSMEVPTVYTNEQLMEMLQNPNLTQEEKMALTEALQRKSR